MTFAQILTNAKARCNVSSESQYDIAIKLWINDGQRDILNRYLWDFSRDYQDLSTVASTEEYSLAQPCIVYNARNVTSTIPMRFIKDIDFDRQFPSPTATGAPRYFRMSGQSQVSSSATVYPKVQLYPIPDTVYTIRLRYFKRYPDLSADSDISPIPEAYHELLVNYACNVFFSSQGDVRAVEQYTKYENGLMSLVEQQNAQPASQIDILRSVDDTLTGEVVRWPESYPNAVW